MPDEGHVLLRGAIAPWAKGQSPYYRQTLEALASHYEFDKATRWQRAAGDRRSRCSSTARSGEKIGFRYDEDGRNYEVSRPFEGVLPNLERRWRETDSAWVREEMERYQSNRPCEACDGLPPEARGAGGAGSPGSTSARSARMSIREAPAWFEARRRQA